MNADSKQRQHAITPDQSFIVQAPAGSGKTELLIQRYLRLLSSVEFPEEIIAITFTRKAAAEMQTRVLEAINKARINHTAQSDHERLTLELAKQVLQRDQVRQWQLSETPGRLRIQTIDSLCANLSRQMPLLSQMGTRTETVDDPRELYEQAAINALHKLESENQWSKNIARLLMHLDNDLPRLKTLLINMLTKRDQWLRYVVAKHDRKDMEVSLQAIIQEHLLKLTEYFPKEFTDELCSLARYAAHNLKISEIESPIVACLAMDGMPSNHADDVGQWLGLRELLMTKSKSNWRIKLNKNHGFPSPSANKAEAELRKSMKIRIEALLQQLQEHSGFKQLLWQTALLPSAHYSDDDWLIVGAMCDLLMLLEAELRLVFAKTNQVDFTAITQSALSALGDDDAPTDLALYLDYQIHHILVDEYQDISYSQYQLLQRLIAGWSTDEAKTVFLVGDPMQSIYRFREAEVGIFVQTWHQQRLHQIALTPLSLSVNFRSSHAIVEWVNTQFQIIMPGYDDISSGAVSFSPCQASNDSGTEADIKLCPLISRTDDEESEFILQTVQSILSSSTEETLAILVQSRSHLLRIISALKQANISYRAIDIDPLAGQSVIQDLLAITRAFTHLADRVAWLAVLRAPWCGIKLQSMITVFADNKEELIWQSLQDDNRLALLEADERQRLLRVRDAFAEALKNKQRYTLSHTIESIWMSLDGPATLESAIELQDADSFFQLLSKQEKAGELPELSSLSAAIDKLYASSDQDPAIRLQIMSMHKAKGLEFDHVILPGLGRRPRSEQNDLLMWMMKTDDVQKLIMAPIKQSGADENTIYQYIKQHNVLKQSYEDARLLYVATTRAKKTLTLVAHAQVKIDKSSGELQCSADKRSLLHHLWPGFKQKFEAKLDHYNAQQTETDITLIDQGLRRVSAEYKRPPLKPLFNSSSFDVMGIDPEANVEYQWAGDNIKHIGTTVHRYIQHIAEQGLQNWSQDRIDNTIPGFRNHLKSLGAHNKDLNWASARVKQALSNMVADTRGQWILNDDHQYAENELALSGLVKGSVINIKIDRTFIDEKGVRWIIDYKTSRHEEADIEQFLDQEQVRYQEQLERYALIIEKLTSQVESHPIRMGLYFPLLCGWREWSV